jgi:membrane protein
MAVTIAFLLLASSLLGIAVSAFGERLTQSISPHLSVAALYGLEETLSLGVVTLLFMLMFTVLPDAHTDWRDVWVGALATSLLFSAGKLAVGLYVSKIDPGEAFGAAGSLAVILLWVYYSSIIFFLGAEFTRILASRRGRGIQPKQGAVRLRADR